MVQFEQLLKFMSKLIGNSLLFKLPVLIFDLTSFYIGFFVQESIKLTTRNLFVWKSANFADSYWFLYNDKNSLTETLILK